MRQRRLRSVCSALVQAMQRPRARAPILQSCTLQPGCVRLSDLDLSLWAARILTGRHESASRQSYSLELGGDGCRVTLFDSELEPGSTLSGASWPPKIHWLISTNITKIMQ